jgi:hypothetical protein
MEQFKLIGILKQEIIWMLTNINARVVKSIAVDMIEDIAMKKIS